MRVEQMSKDQLVAEVQRLRGKKRAHRKSLIDQQKAILERNSRIRTLEEQVSAMAFTIATLPPMTPLEGTLA